MIQIVFIPGNGGGTPKDNWFPYLKIELSRLKLKVIDIDFPDNIIAPENSWSPFLKKLGVDKKTILIGHSTGAIAAMRFAENQLKRLQKYGEIITVEIPEIETVGGGSARCMLAEVFL